MKHRFDGLTIVETEYLEELEEFKKSMRYIPEISPVSYKDIVNIDTYKESFAKYLENARMSVARQRSTDVGNEEKLLGALDILGSIIQDVKNIDVIRAKYEADKQEKEEAKKKEKEENS